MKKSLLTIAVAATMLTPAIVMADATLYGNIHVSINDFDTAKNIDMTSNTSAFGVKGSEGLGDGVKAIYKMEFQVDATDGGTSDISSVNFGDATATPVVPPSSKKSSNGNALTQRDVWVGLKGGMGTIKFGTMTSNYKQMGGKVDGLYRTQLEGRGFLNTQSAQLHKGRGTNRGRQTNTIQYVSPKMSGFQLIANTTISGSDDETNGVGIRWSNKSILAYVDFIDGETSVGSAVTESATKVGARYKTKAFSVAGQYEDAEDRTGFNYVHLNGAYNINKNNAIILTVGQAAHITNGALDTTGVAVAYNHKMSKLTNVYIGYGDRSSDTAASEESLFTAGIKKKF